MRVAIVQSRFGLYGLILFACLFGLGAHVSSAQ